MTDQPAPIDVDEAARIDTLETQQAYMTRALTAALEGRWTGADSVEAWLYAINPQLQGTLELDPPVVSS